MSDLKLLQQTIENELLQLHFPNQPINLYEPIRYMLSMGGKRLRPVLVLMGCQLFDGEIKQALNPAMGIEVFHNFTLLHDDIMDNAPLRRSQPTVHNKWNSSIAILSGDAMFVKACQLMMKVSEQHTQSVMTVFLRTAVEVCEGQQMDMSFEQATDVSIADYLKMIELKTAVLLGCSLQIGAIIAGATEQKAQHLYEFGKHMGIAFQLQDDLLDVYGDAEKFGKQNGGDILSDKKTFLLLKAKELANPQQLSVLNKWIHRLAKGDEKQKIEAIKKLYDELGIRQQAEQEMESHYNNALQHLQTLDIAMDKKAPLEKFAAQLMVREV